MKYEVEQKFPVDDLAMAEHSLAAMEVEISGARIEVDVYYAHPARDFAATDEALRIRRVERRSLLTYKGPKIDAATKTRQEIELPLGTEESSAAAWGELLEALGFRPVAEVRKQRRKAMVPWQGRQVEVSLDQVEPLGSFVELESVAAPEDVESAKACVASLAATMGLVKTERRSYLELLLEASSRRVILSAAKDLDCHGDSSLRSE